MIGAWLPFAAILLLAFAFRFAYLLEATALPLFHTPISDAQAYWDWSDRIAAGDWLGDSVFYQAPLYPYFLALVKLVVGADPWNVRLIQIALGSLACGVLFLAGREFFSRRAGIVAGVLLALYPPAIFFDTLIQKANLGLVWMTLLLWLLARVQKRAGAWRTGATGLLLGLLMLTREETLLLVPVLAVWLLVGRPARSIGRRALGLGAFGLGLALVLLPVVWRNANVGGELVLTTSQAGTNFYIGNGPKAVGIYVPLKPGRGDPSYERADAIDLAEAALGRELTPQEVSSYWFDAAFAQIRSHPVQWLGLLLHKARLLVNWYEIPDAEDLYFFERSSHVLRVLGIALHLGVLLPLAAAGAVLCSARWRELAVLYAVLGALACGVIGFYLMARYRYPLVPGLALLGGAGLVAGFERVRARRWRDLAPAGGVLVAALALCNVTIYARDFQLAQSYHNSGVALEQQHRLAEAASAYREALRLQPSVVETWSALGEALRKLKRSDEAIDAFQEARRLQPEEWRHSLQIGVLWLEQQEFERAVGALRRATATAGAGDEAWKALASAAQNTGRWREASDAWRRARVLDPADPATQQELAFLLATCPDPAVRNGAEALAIAEAVAAQADASDLGALDVLAAAQAENGRFDAALSTIRRARGAAEQRGDTALVQALLQREATYAQRRPWRPAH